MECPHCDTPIDEHEASRCLDAWVDFVVFGAEPRIMSNGQIVGRKFFSTDIAAAWEMVEQLCSWKRDDNMLTLKGQGPTPEHPDEQEGWYDAEIAGAAGKWESLNADTAPLAICRAALKAAQ